MILHNKRMAAIAAGLFAAGGVNVAEGQDNKLGGQDGKAWVRQQGVGNTRLDVDIKPADVEIVHYLPTDPKKPELGGKVVPQSDVRSVDIAPRGKPPQMVAQDIQGNRISSAYVNTGSAKDGIVQASDINDLRAQGYKYETVLEGRDQSAATRAAARNDREQESAAARQEQQAKPAPAAAPKAAVPVASLMADMAKEARGVDKADIDGVKGNTSQRRADYANMSKLETAFRKDPQAATPETQQLIRDAVKGPNADIMHDYVRDRLDGKGAEASKIELRGRLQGREAGTQPVVPVDAQAAAPRAAASAPAGVAAQPKQAAGDTGGLSERQMAQLRPHVNGASMAIDLIRDRYTTGSGISNAQISDLVQSYKDAGQPQVADILRREADTFARDGVTRENSGQFKQELRALRPAASPAPRGVENGRVPADQGRDVSAEVQRETQERLQRRSPEIAALGEAIRGGQTREQALAARATEGTVTGPDNKPIVVSLPGNANKFVLWEKGGQYELKNAAELSALYKEKSEGLNQGNMIGNAAILQEVTEGMGALSGDVPSTPGNPNDPKVKSAIERELAQPQASVAPSEGLNWTPNKLG